MIGRARAFGRFLAGLSGFLDTPMTYEEACGTIRVRQAMRHCNFLAMVRDCVYGNPRSPYLPLLRAAGCEYGDLAAHLASDSLESLLKRLAEAGVRVTPDQFKGRAPIVGDGREYPVAVTDFDNIVLRRGVEVRTGGSTGRPVRTLIDLDFLADRACYEHVMFRMLDLHGVRFALWYPRVPMSIGLTACLRYAKVGRTTDNWFDMEIGGSALGPWHAWALTLTIAASRRSRAPMPWPVAAPLARPDRVVDWMVDARGRHGRCAVQSNVSGILRLTRAAKGRGAELSGVQFIAGSEPLTPDRRTEIASTGASVYQRYYAVDLGSIACGCGAADGGDRLHLLSDTIAAIGGEPPSMADGSVPLLLTSTLATGPRVVLNVDLGDRAVMSERQCSCQYGELGFPVHLSHIRSTTRSTAEGAALPYAELVRISEHVLPTMLGGSALDFQWVEDDEPGSRLTRLWLRVAPGVAAVDEARVRAAILDALGRRSDVLRFYAHLIAAADSLRILREQPRITPSGKTPPVMKGLDTGMGPGSERRGD